MIITSTIAPRSTLEISLVTVGHCIRHVWSGDIFMRTQCFHPQSTPEWVRLNDGEMFSTESLEKNGAFLLADVEAVVHG